MKKKGLQNGGAWPYPTQPNQPLTVEEIRFAKALRDHQREWNRAARAVVEAAKAWKGPVWRKIDLLENLDDRFALFNAIDALEKVEARAPKKP